MATALHEWASRTSSAVVLLSVLIICACDRKGDSSSRSADTKAVETASQAPEKPNRVIDPGAGYTLLASNLADPLLDDPNPPVYRKELAQLFADAQVKVVRYQSVESGDPLIKKVTQEATDSVNGIMLGREKLMWMSDDAAFKNFLHFMLALIVGDSSGATNAGGEFLHSGDQRREEYVKWAKALNRCRAAQLMLPEAAKQFAPARSRNDLISLDLDEAFAASADHDRATLTNVSGETLTHCTVVVELHGSDGTMVKNVHYVESWPSGTKKYARYGIGADADQDAYGRRTVYGIRDATVSCWSDQARQENLPYKYVGVERDRDVRTVLDGKMKIMYRYDSNKLFGGPEVGVALTGVPVIPAHLLTIVFTPKSQDTKLKPVSLSWNQPEWKADQLRSLSLGSKIAFAPSSLEIRVSFPDVGYVYTRQVTLPQ